MSEMISFGILTLSDRSSRHERDDLSGPALKELILSKGWEVVRVQLLPDDQDQIEKTLVVWADEGAVDIILTTGGTGFSPRDVTPEATLNVIDREAPGLAEAMRAESLKITPHAMLSRIVAGTRKKTLIVNLPGSPKGAVENLQVILPVIPHAVSLLKDQSGSETAH